MSSYGLRVNIGTVMSIAHGGSGARAHGEIANTRALATTQSGDLCGDSIKYYGSMQPRSVNCFHCETHAYFESCDTLKVIRHSKLKVWYLLAKMSETLARVRISG
ncbi:hypothetical protein K440DRAFT_107421 [Wilcoxina mikolae CBS 423.85]|nr:hypothetical protein K440DRAFT_107421 [Wilcoxina mikolae CBS 423.85]